MIVLCCAVRETAVTASHAHPRVVNRWLDRTGITDIDDCFMCACVFDNLLRNHVACPCVSVRVSACEKKTKEIVLDSVRLFQSTSVCAFEKKRKN